MQYIYVLDYSTPSRVTIEVDDNIDVEEKIDDILSVNNLKASDFNKFLNSYIKWQ